jgi:hypothetical protein
LVGDRNDPLEKLAIEIVEARERLAPEEPLDVLDARLDLALGLGSVGPMGMRPEPVIPAEVPKNGIPLEPRAREVPAVSLGVQ